MTQKFSNNAATALYSSILAGANTLTVTPGTGDQFPAVTGGSGLWFLVTMEDNAGK